MPPPESLNPAVVHCDSGCWDTLGQGGYTQQCRSQRSQGGALHEQHLCWKLPWSQRVNSCPARHLKHHQMNPVRVSRVLNRPVQTGMVSVVLLQLSPGPDTESGWNCPELLVPKNTELTDIWDCLAQNLHALLFISSSVSCAKTSLISLSTQAVKWPRKQVFTSLGTTALPSLGMLQCPCSGGYSTIALLLLRHMTANMLFSQADKCFLSITANYVCQLLISSQYLIVCFVSNCIFRMKFSCLI